MRLNLRLKLAFVLLLISALAVSGTALLAQWSFERGFVRQVQARQRERVQTTVAALAEEYSLAGGWSRVQRERRRWLQILFAASRPDGRYPRWARRFEAEDDSRWPPQPRRGQADAHDDDDRRLNAAGSDRGGRRARRDRLQQRMMLLGAQRELLIGNADDVRRLQLTPIVIDTATVGYLGVLPGPALHELADIRFVDEQKRQFLVIAVAFVLLVGVLAFPLSSALTARVRAIARAARELAAGHYATRVAVDSHDELGRLATDFNDLASALERTERSRREWVADISHELRTPLATMRAEVEALQDGVRPLSTEAVDALHLDVLRLGRLVDDLYDLSRSDLGALSYHKQSLDPCAVLGGDLQALAMAFEKRRIALKYKPLADARIHADADRLSQLFRNLLNNSLRYTDAGGRLEIAVARTADEIIFTFEDSAPGVPEVDLPFILQRFHRVERSRNRDSGGAGLGLAICESIARAHGGRIDVHQGVLGGLGVQVSLPLVS